MIRSKLNYLDDVCLFQYDTSLGYSYYVSSSNERDKDFTIMIAVIDLYQKHRVVNEFIHGPKNWAIA